MNTDEQRSLQAQKDVYEIRRAALSAARLTKQLVAFGSPQRAHAKVLNLNAIVARATCS